MLDKENILNNLEILGFNRKEGEVFLELIKNPKSNGSQIAKILGYPRTTVYQLLDILQKKGYILSFLDKEVTYYETIPLSELFDNYKKNINNATKFLKNELNKIESSSKQKQFYNLNSYNEVKEKIKNSLKKAKNKVFINTNMDLYEFEDEFKYLNEKGTKIILFSFSNVDCNLSGVDIYIRKSFNPTITEYEKRIMIAIDNSEAIICGNYEGEFNGIYSENRLLVNIVIEHIRNDINILKMNNKYGEELLSSIALEL